MRGWKPDVRERKFERKVAQKGGEFGHSQAPDKQKEKKKKNNGGKNRIVSNR